MPCRTTRIRGFAESSALCWVLFVGHSAKKPLSSAALGKVLLSVMTAFTKSRALSIEIHSAKAALGKGPSAAVYSWRPLGFAERWPLALGKEASLPSVNRLTLDKECFAECHPRTLGKVYFIFFFSQPNFCGMFLHYVDLHVPFWHNYKSVSYNYWI
jgi:hypothetical protein